MPAALRARSATPGIRSTAFSVWKWLVGRSPPVSRITRAASSAAGSPLSRDSALRSRTSSGANSRDSRPNSPLPNR